MKKIKDYINKDKVAIHCSSKEEWDKIIDLFNQDSISINVSKRYWENQVNGGKSDTISIDGKGWSPKKHYEFNNHTVYPASDFLSNTHPFEVGKWYKSSRWVNIKAAKFLKIKDNGKFSYSERINTNGYEKVEDSTDTDRGVWYTFSEVPIEQIQLISLPEEEEKGWIPQVGDWVVLISGEGKPNWNNDMNEYVGKCVKLIGKQKCFYIQEDNKNWSWEYSERTKHFRKALPHEISSNKINNEYGLYVGYKLDANIITKWATLEKNKWDSYYRWKKSDSVFNGNRVIEQIDIKDGVAAFLVSGTMNIWLKAEGFREFDAHESLQEKEGFEGKKDFVELSNKGIGVQIYIPGDKKTITTNINTVTSIQEQLIKPKQTILF